MAFNLINFLPILLYVTVVVGQNGEKFLYTGGFGFDLITTSSLNQDTLPFTREIDLTHVLPLGHELQKALGTYHAICKKYYGDAKTRKQAKFNSQRSFFGLQQNVTYTLGVTTSFFSPGFTTIPKMNATCLDQNGHLPEFRRNAQQVLQALCIKYNISSMPVAIEVNNTNLVFPSDQSFIAYNPFTHVEIYLNNVLHKYSVSGRIFDEHLAQLHTLTALVDNCHTDKPALRFRVPNQFQLQPCICEIDNPSNSDSDSSSAAVIHSWIETACTFDLVALEAQVEHSLLEISSITNVTLMTDPQQQLPETLPNQSPHIDNLKVNLKQPLDDFDISSSSTLPPVAKSRQARFLHLLPKMATNLTGISLSQSIFDFEFSYGNIFHSLGLMDFKAWKEQMRLMEAMRASTPKFLILDLELSYHIQKPLFDLLDTDWKPLVQFMLGDAPPLATAKQLAEVANSLRVVAINQEQIESSIKIIEKSLINVHTKLNDHMYASTLYAAIQDVKFNIQLGNQVITNFVAKLANLLIAAQAGQTSPYALNKHELHQIAQAVKSINSNLILTKHVAEVKTTIVHDGYKQLILILNIPITNKRHLYNIYKVIPVPKFSQNATFIPSYSSSNLAISVTNEFYTTLTELELNHCLQDPNTCRTHRPVRLFNDTTFDCIISSFQFDTLACPLQLTHQSPAPFVYFSDLQALYSVPHTTHFRSHCLFQNLPPKTTEGELSNSGIHTFQPNCKLTFTCDKHTLVWHTPSKHPVRSLSPWQTFQNLNLKFASKNITVLLPNEIVNTNLNLTLTKVHIPTWTEIFADAYQPNKSIPFFILCIITVFTIIICAILIRICCALGIFRCNCRSYKTSRRQRRPLPKTPDIETPSQRPEKTYNRFSQIDIPTSNTAETHPIPILQPQIAHLHTFKPIPLLEMKAITDSMSNLDLVKIEESAFTPPLPLKSRRPSMAAINEDYVEMEPLMSQVIEPAPTEPASTAVTDEQMASTEIVTITDNVCSPIYSDPMHRFRPRFRFTPAVMKSMEHLNCTKNPAHD